MKATILFLFMIFTFSVSAQKLEKLWSLPQMLKTPESVLYDSQLNLVFVANMGEVLNEKTGDGFISLMNLKGEVVVKKWIKGLNDPKGMASKYGKLYITDMDELVVIDIATISIKEKYHLPKAKFLNDVTTTKRGKIFFSDTRDKSIYLFEDDSCKLWLRNDSLENVNGLWAEGGKLYAGNASVWEIDIATKEMTELFSGAGGVDGLEKIGENSFVFSNWGGRIYVSQDTIITKVLDTAEEKINSADIDYIPENNTVLVPTFHDNSVVAYKLIIN